jgi:hypothetical protein
MDEENRQKMITAMRMMKEACRSNDSWDGCEKCPFDSFCTMLQRSAIKLYHKKDYAQSCPMAWKPDKIEEDEK